MQTQSVKNNKTLYLSGNKSSSKINSGDKLFSFLGRFLTKQKFGFRCIYLFFYIYIPSLYKIFLFVLAKPKIASKPLVAISQENNFTTYYYTGAKAASL